MEETGVTRKLAAILAADVVGYSRLMGSDEVGTLARLTRCRAELIDPGIERHHGRIVKTTGDGLLVEFASVVDAVQCAVELQTELAARGADEPAESRLAFRMGVNLGDVIVAGDDIYGDGVNVAARLEGLARPGGICLSRAARDQVRDKLSLELEDRGEVEVKNIARPVRAFDVVIPGLEPAGATAPPAAAPVAERPSIAVLPFVNMSNDPDQEYFADGITEDVITALSRLPSLDVTARNSSSAYKGRSAAVQEVAKELGVRYVVEGSIRKAANRVRISVELADAIAGKQLWAERFDRELDDVFELQDEITENIVAALPSRLEAAELERAKQKPPNDLAAYDCLLRSLEHRYRATKEDNAQAIRFLDKAIEIDPNYAHAYALRACTLGQAYERGFADDKDWVLREMVECAEKSWALDDDDVDCHRVLSDVHVLQGELDQAWMHHEKAFSLNPNDPRIVSQRGELMVWLGQAEEAVQMIEKAMRLDPRAADRRAGHLGVALHAAGRYAEAIAAFKRVPRKAAGQHAHLAACYARLGETERAAAEARTVLEMTPDFSAARHLARLPYRREEDRAHHREGLHLAGLPE